MQSGDNDCSVGHKTVCKELVVEARGVAGASCGPGKGNWAGIFQGTYLSLTAANVRAVDAVFESPLRAGVGCC